MEQEQEVVEMEISNSLSGHLIREYVNSYLRYAVALKKEGNFNPEKIEKIVDQEVTVTLLSKEESVSSQYSKEKFGVNYFAYSPFIYFSVFIYLFGTIFSKMKGKEVAKRIAIAMKDERRVMLEQFLAGLTIVALIVGINLTFVGILAPEFYASSQALKIFIVEYSFGNFSLCFVIPLCSSDWRESICLFSCKYNFGNGIGIFIRNFCSFRIGKFIWSQHC